MSREAIAELVYEYNHAVNTRDADRWGACWAEDAVWHLSGGRTAEGRAAIVDLWVSSMADNPAVVQFAADGRVDVDGDEATGQWHIQAHGRRPSGVAHLLLGLYDDTYRVADGHWRFTSRALTVHYQGPPDLSGTFG